LHKKERFSVFTVEEILNMAIKIENNGEKVYRDAISQVEDAALIELLKEMADEESRHAEWFNDLKKEWGSAVDNPLAEEMSRQMFSEIIGDRSFSLKEVNFELVRDRQHLINLFIEFEKDSILFYELIQPFLDKSKTRRMLDEIIKEEHRHIERLQEFFETDAGLVTEKSS
jgi:rubrerythrin